MTSAAASQTSAGAPRYRPPNVRLSLAGVQEELLLTRMTDGKWGRPIEGTPSTHILKPEIEPFQNTVEERDVLHDFLEKNLGLNVAPVRTILVDERPVLVVERYDRASTPTGLFTGSTKRTSARRWGSRRRRSTPARRRAKPRTHRACPTGLRRAISPQRYCELSRSTWRSAILLTPTARLLAAAHPGGRLCDWRRIPCCPPGCTP